MSQSISVNPQDFMRSVIKRIATGPEMSKTISREEARTAMKLILDGKADPVQAGVFLVALRMKRETDDENAGVLDALREATHFAIAPVDELVDIADPYDGFTRHLPASPFLPALLAACGLPAVSHGCFQMGPKFGVTHHQILAAAGIQVNLSPEQAAARIADAKIGWAYVDQSQFSPALNRLVDLRTLIVKRPCVSTLEKITGPVRARGKNILFIGYVHKGYERLLPLMARQAQYDFALVVRGVEGGVLLPLRGAVTCVVCGTDGTEGTENLDSSEIGIQSDIRAPQLPLLSSTEGTERTEGTEEESADFDASKIATLAAEAGIEALEGKSGVTHDSLVFTSAAVLRHAGRAHSLHEGAELARKALDSGQALARFRA